MKDGTFRGVHWNKEQKKYRVSFTLNGKRVDGGSYDDPQQAHDVYLKMSEEKTMRFIIPVTFMEGEEWRQIDGFNNRVMVSNYGRIKCNDYRKSGRESLMAQQITKFGYSLVHLRPRAFAVHTLVWRYFVGNYEKPYELNHKDLKKQNNRLDNLELVYTRENQSHSQQKIYNKTDIGCYWDKRKEKWIALIWYDKKQHYIGAFENRDTAHWAYLNAVNNLGETNKYSYK